MDLASARRTAVTSLGLFAMPLLVTAFVGLAMGSYADPAVRVGVLDRGDTEASRAVLAALRESPDLALHAYDDEASLRAGVHRGRLAGGLVLPPDWDGAAPLVLYASDATLAAPLVRARLDALLAAAARVRLGRPAPLAIDAAVAGGGAPPRVLGFRYTAPANLVMFALIAACTAGSRLAFVRSVGIGARLAATPAGRFELLAGLAIGPLQLLAGQAVFLLAAGWLVFGVDWGPPAAAALLTASLIVACAAIALFLGTLYRSVEQAVALGPFLGMGLGMLGGCWWPLEIAPPSLRAVARFVPSTWAMDGYLDLVGRGGGFGDVWPGAAALLALAAVLFPAAAWRLRRQLAR
jgi:ABC-2 type transport system permease protein